MSVDLQNAMALLSEQAKRAEDGNVDTAWSNRVEALVTACERVARTYIPFLGTAILAKAIDLNNDALAMKAESDQPGAYSARSLCHKVLVPFATTNGIHLGTTGPEPLNNMPFFRMERLDDGTRIAKNATAAFDLLVKLVRDINALRNQEEAKAALRAFIAVRRKRQPAYALIVDAGIRSSDALASALKKFVSERSEHGRRAQAAVAGLLDVAYGYDRIAMERVHNPSREHPGDVCVRTNADSEEFEKAFEVKDKRIQSYHVELFADKCLTFGVREVVIVAVAPLQQSFVMEDINNWSAQQGVNVSLYTEWRTLTAEALFWASLPTPEAAVLACSTIQARLIEQEVSPEGVTTWMELIKDNQP